MDVFPALLSPVKITLYCDKNYAPAILSKLLIFDAQVILLKDLNFLELKIYSGFLNSITTEIFEIYFI